MLIAAVGGDHRVPGRYGSAQGPVIDKITSRRKRETLATLCHLKSVFWMINIPQCHRSREMDGSPFVIGQRRGGDIRGCGGSRVRQQKLDIIEASTLESSWWQRRKKRPRLLWDIIFDVQHLYASVGFDDI